MHPIDRAVLELCRDDFQTVKPLRDTIAQGSLYRHVQQLLRLGWLEKRGIYYKDHTSGASPTA